jgi:hypothetical protein
MDNAMKLIGQDQRVLQELLSQSMVQRCHLMLVKLGSFWFQMIPRESIHLNK